MLLPWAINPLQNLFGYRYPWRLGQRGTDVAVVLMSASELRQVPHAALASGFRARSIPVVSLGQGSSPGLGTVIKTSTSLSRVSAGVVSVLASHHHNSNGLTGDLAALTGSELRPHALFQTVSPQTRSPLHSDLFVSMRPGGLATPGADRPRRSISNFCESCFIFP